MRSGHDISLVSLPDPAGIFGGGVGCLSDRQFLTHFASDRGVSHPALPAATPEQIRNADRVCRGRFEIVGEDHFLPPGFSWKTNPSADKEWQIAHHKFYFAVDLAHAYRASGDPKYLRRWVELIDSWLAEMGSGFIAASDAQVEAKRIEHWVTSFLLLRAAAWENHVSGDFLRRFLARIAEETWYISQNLRPSRNHRTFQLYTMFLVGVLFPEFARSDDFREGARVKLTENLLTDFLPDGVHVELSSHYHQITLETAVAFVELAVLNAIELDPALLERLHRALEFSMFLTWPDGEIPLINDSDNGNHLPLLTQGARLTRDRRLQWVASLGREGVKPTLPSRHFEASGYFVFSDGWGVDSVSFAQRQHVFYDCAALGEGSHSHYDLFNFCYHLNGEQLIVDPGRYTYSAEPDGDGIDWRRAFKSTAYHNTVTIDRKDQTRYLSKSSNPPPGVERFERGRHAAKHGPDVEVRDKESFLGRHTDWVRAAARSHEYSPRHSRTFVYMLRQYLMIFDEVRVDDGQAHECDLRFHFAPQWLGRMRLEAVQGAVRAAGEGWSLHSVAGQAVQAQLERGWVSKSYGVKRPAPVLSVRQAGGTAMSYGTAIGPCHSRDGGFELLGVSRIDLESPDMQGFCVELVANRSNCRDVFLFGSTASAPYEDEYVRYHGRLLAYRRNAEGVVTYFCATDPQALEIKGGAQAGCFSRGVLEWSAATVS